jgi:3,5-epimerase/4-reductase
MKILVFGGKGWIGTQLCDLMSGDPDLEIIHAESRADDELRTELEILDTEPDRIVCLLGRTSGPGCNSIDYLEQKGKLIENLRDNLFAPLVLANIATKYDIHFTYLGTGCIFNGGYDIGGFVEDDLPNYFGSSYSTVKGFTDRIMHMFDNSVLNIRIRMPVSADLNPRSLITKLLSYKKICSTDNSITVLPEMLPIMIDLIKRGTTSTINLTNPGTISHNEILEMAREIINPYHTWENFTEEEQSKILASSRSNNYLNTDKLQQMYPCVLPVESAIRKVLTTISNQS